MTNDIIIFSDIEMGAGTSTDDFNHDKLLSEIILDLKKESKNNPIDLVFNGDTFDFLKCPVVKGKKYTYPKKINEVIALQKLESIYKAHRMIFDSIKEFLQNKGNRVYFLYGNHDYEILFGTIQDKIKSLLKASDSNVSFGFLYKTEHVHIEHGNRHDKNTYIPDNYIRKSKNQSILNIPLLDSNFTGAFMKLKEKYPMHERIENKRGVALINKRLSRVVALAIAKYFYYNIIDLIGKIFSKDRHTLIKSFIFPLHKLMTIELETFDLGLYTRRVSKTPSTKLIIFGHIHRKHQIEMPSYKSFTLDTWRDEYLLDVKTKTLYPKTKRYAKIITGNDNVQLEFTQFERKAGEIDYIDVINDELLVNEVIREQNKSLTKSDFNIKKESYKIDIRN